MSRHVQLNPAITDVTEQTNNICDRWFSVIVNISKDNTTKKIKYHICFRRLSITLGSVIVGVTVIQKESDLITHKVDVKREKLRILNLINQIILHQEDL